jgi:hypothetical protein
MDKAMSAALSYRASHREFWNARPATARLDEEAWIAVHQGEDATFVDLGSLPTLMVQGRLVIALADLWKTAAAGGRLRELVVHFASDDGFHTRGKSDMGVPAMLLEHVFVDAITRDLVWTIDVPWFFEVKRLAAVHMLHQSEIATYEIAAD